MCGYDSRELGAYIWEHIVSLGPAKEGETSKGLDFRVDGSGIGDQILGLSGFPCRSAVEGGSS